MNSLKQTTIFSKKNVFRCTYVFCIILFGITSCEKSTDETPPDYRNKFIGSYNFINYYYSEFNCFWCEPRYVNITRDTSYYTGIIEKYEENKLKIIFTPDFKEPDGSTKTIYGLIYPTLDDSSSILTYPDMFTEYSWKYFRGNFIGTDTIVLFYGFFAHAGEEQNFVFGIKIH